MVLSVQRVSPQQHLHSASVHPFSLKQLNSAEELEVTPKSPRSGHKRKASEASTEACPKGSIPDSFEKRAKTTPGKAATPSLSHSGSDSSFQRFALALPDLVELPSLSSSENKKMNLLPDSEQTISDLNLQNLKGWQAPWSLTAELLSDATSRPIIAKPAAPTQAPISPLAQVRLLLASYAPKLSSAYKQALENALLEFVETGNKDLQVLSNKHMVTDSKLKSLIQRYKKTRPST